MFSWVKNKVATFRFELGFRPYERGQREKHLSEAERRFGGFELRAEISALRRKIKDEADEEFQLEIDDIGSKLVRAQTNLKTLQSDLTLLSRDYRAELSPLYDELNALKGRIDKLYDEKEGAFARKDAARKSINSWYAKSERSFFGNKGKRIPKHSMFGQSFGDLEAYKADRDEASEDIVECAQKISDLKSRKGQVGERIAQLKRDRSAMYALKSNGGNRKDISNAVATCRDEAARLAARKAAIERDLSSFVEIARHRYGLVSREATLANLDKRKAEFIQSFGTRQAHLRRRVDFKRIMESPWPK